MTDTKELSLGNLLMQGNDIATVRGLPTDDFIQYSIESRDNDIIYGEPYESFDPIELTEEWLNKFLLPKRQIKTKAPYYIYSIRNDFEIYSYMDQMGKCLLYGVNSIGNFFLIRECPSVHDFQNIYAILNPHEELTIKK